MEVELEGLVWDELVDEHAARAGDAVADEGDEVAVVHPADDVHLGLELALPLAAAGLELLHGHRLAAGEHPLVHVPEPALPDQVLLREAPRRRRELLVGERPLAHPRRVARRRRRAGLGQPWRRWRRLRPAGVAAAAAFGSRGVRVEMRDGVVRLLLPLPPRRRLPRAAEAGGDEEHEERGGPDGGEDDLDHGVVPAAARGGERRPGDVLRAGAATGGARRRGGDPGRRRRGCAAAAAMWIRRRRWRRDGWRRGGGRGRIGGR
ncbi:Os03g0776150, partial [Oryza sativa Japonica Group]